MYIKCINEINAVIIVSWSDRVTSNGRAHSSCMAPLAAIDKVLNPVYIE